MLILGSDFWRKFQIVPDLRHREWTFAVDSMEWCTSGEKSVLSEREKKKLDELFDKVFSNQPHTGHRMYESCRARD